jgi:hypothetical protein
MNPQMYIVGLTTFSLHLPLTPLATYCLFRRGNKKGANGHPHLFPEGAASPATHKQTFLLLLFPDFCTKREREGNTPRPTVPKYLRSPTH